MSLRPAVMRRLMKEIAQLKTEPLEGIRVASPDEDMLDVTGIIEGPAGTPYEGGYFRVKFSFTEEFPSAPPRCMYTSFIPCLSFSSCGLGHIVGLSFNVDLATVSEAYSCS